jgi:hypothetical protein
MDIFAFTILAVAFERILVVISALTSIVLGWSLFTRAITQRQSGRIELGNWKVELQSVGPGIFFSLFGSAILTYAFLNPAEYKIRKDADKPFGIELVAKGLAPSEDADLRSERKEVRAINTIYQLKQQIDSQRTGANPVSTLLPAQTKDLIAAANILLQRRQEILTTIFGAAAIDEWEKNKHTYETARRQLPGDTISRMEKIAPWFTENAADGEATKP